MAMIRCSKCGKEISSMATECQYCGVPMVTAIGNTHIPPPILPSNPQRGRASIPPSNPQNDALAKFEKLNQLGNTFLKGGCALGVIGVILPILALIIFFILGAIFL